MSNNKTELYSELIKEVIREGINQPLNFLETELNKLKEVVRSDLKGIREEVVGCSKRLNQIVLEIEALKEKTRALKTELTDVKNNVSVPPTKIWVEEGFKTRQAAERKLAEELALYRDQNDRQMKDLHEKHEAIGGRQRELKIKIDDMHQDVERIKERATEFNQLCSKRAEDHETRFVALSEECRKYLDSLAGREDVYERKIERIENMAEVTQKRIREDSSNCTRMLTDKFEKLSAELVGQVGRIKARCQNNSDEINRLEQTALKAASDRRLDREINDFMKQVAYNATRIEQLQQKLEGR